MRKKKSTFFFLNLAQDEEEANVSELRSDTVGELVSALC